MAGARPASGPSPTKLVPTIGAALSDDGAATPIWLCWSATPTRERCWLRRPTRLTRLIATTSRGQLGCTRPRRCAPRPLEAVALWEGDSAIAIGDLAAEVASEVRLVRAAEVERARHEHAREAAMACVDLAGLAASPPGLGPVGTAQLVATMGRPGRFPNGGAFMAFTGLTPRASETGQTDRKHQPMTKAAPGRCAQLVQSANTARSSTPARRRLPRPDDPAWRPTARRCVRLPPGWLSVFGDHALRGEPYVICDLQGRPVTPGAGQTADRRALHRHRRGPLAAALHQEGGEALPHGARGARQVTARSWTRGDLPRASLTTPSRIVNQTRRPLDTPASP